MADTCRVPGCPNIHYGKGLCEKHLKRVKRAETKAISQLAQDNAVVSPVLTTTVPVVVSKSTKSTIKEARQALQNRSLDFVENFILTIIEARAKGHYEQALDAWKWLIEHAPAGEDGLRIIDESAAKPKAAEAKASGPIVQIGIAFAGNKTKELPPAQVIDVEPEKDDQ